MAPTDKDYVEHMSHSTWLPKGYKRLLIYAVESRSDCSDALALGSSGTEGDGDFTWRCITGNPLEWRSDDLSTLVSSEKGSGENGELT